MTFRIEHKSGKQKYIYEVTSYWDKEKKQSRQKRTYIGKKDETTGETITPLKSRKPKLCQDYGCTYLLDKIAERIKLKEALVRVFPNSYKEILGLAYYSICENKALYYYEEWKELNYFEENNETTLNSKEISRFLKSINSDKHSIEEFFQEWINAQKHINTLFFDITSFSSYSNNIEFVEWGHNRDCEALPQINYGIIADEKTKLPLYYKIYPGSISDVTTLKNILKNLKNFKIEKSTIILDRGFYSAKNVDGINESGKFIIPLPFSVEEAQKVIDKNLKLLQSHTSAFILKDELLHYAKDKVKIAGKNYTAHIYYDEQKAGEERKAFIKKLINIEQHIKENNKITREYLKGNFKGYDRFYTVDEKNKKMLRNDSIIESYMRKMGCCVIITNNEKLMRDEVLDLYRRRNDIELMFDSLKNELDGGRLRSHSQETIEARLFIKFIGLILYSALLKDSETSKEFNGYSIKKLLFELRKIKIIFMNDNKTNYVTEVSRKQKDIFKIFKTSPPG